MSLETLIKPIGNGADDVLVLAETAKDAFTRRDSSEQLVEWRHQAVGFTLGAAIAVTGGLIALHSLNRMRRASHRYHDWKVMDGRLDAALESAGNTSEVPTVL